MLQDKLNESPAAFEIKGEEQLRVKTFVLGTEKERDELS